MLKQGRRRPQLNIHGQDDSGILNNTANPGEVSDNDLSEDMDDNELDNLIDGSETNNDTVQITISMIAPTTSNNSILNREYGKNYRHLHCHPCQTNLPKPFLNGRVSHQIGKLLKNSLKRLLAQIM